MNNENTNNNSGLSRHEKGPDSNEYLRALLQAGCVLLGQPVVLPHKIVIRCRITVSSSDPAYLPHLVEKNTPRPMDVTWEC